MSQTLEAKFDDYAQRVRDSLSAQPFMDKMLGAGVRRIEPGLVEISLPVTEQLLQPHGNVHGIIASALADSAAGYAAQTLLPEGFDVVTVEYKINYLTAGIGEVFSAIGQVTRAGRTLSVYTADVYAENNGDKKLFAHMVTTMMAVASS